MNVTFRYLIIAVICLAVQPLRAEPASLHGVWQPVTYVIQGDAYPMTGLMIITPKYFSANTLFKLEQDTGLDANANAGPYYLADGKIVLNQWMQLHWRPDKPGEHFLAQEVVEEIPYKIEDEKLIFFFPSGNMYISERLE